MNISKFITGIRRFFTYWFILAPAMLFSFFFIFSFFLYLFNPTESKVIILQNEGYWAILNTLIGVGNWIFIVKAQKYFEEYKKWKEEAIYQKQLKKGIDDRYTDELSEVRREDFLDF